MTEPRDFSFSSSFAPRRRDALRLLSAATLGAGTWPVFAQDGKRLPRLVTVSGAITEVVYALGAEGQLVGTDTTSPWCVTWPRA